MTQQFNDQFNSAHLDWLESESIHILRELAAECERPALLFSGGKDSLVVLHLALKAFRPNKLPFPLVHIDTGHNFPEVIEFRDYIVAKTGEKLIVGSVEESIKKGTVRLRNPDTDSRNAAHAVTPRETTEAHPFAACIGRARPEAPDPLPDPPRLSFRDDFGQWDPKAQRPELWSLYNTRVHKGENMRVFPISNWTEMDIWQYIEREKLELPSIYFAHQREVYERNGLIVSNMPITPPLTDSERASMKMQQVRFRTVGDMTCTSPVASDADDVDKILAETAETTITERGATRLDDQTSEASMEKRKKEGYF